MLFHLLQFNNGSAGVAVQQQRADHLDNYYSSRDRWGTPWLLSHAGYRCLCPTSQLHMYSREGYSTLSSLVYRPHMHIFCIVGRTGGCCALEEEPLKRQLLAIPKTWMCRRQEGVNGCWGLPRTVDAFGLPPSRSV